MIEFIVEVLLCAENCEVIGKKVARYQDAETCLTEEVEGVTASVSAFVLKNGGSYQDVLDLLGPLYVSCTEAD